MNGPGSRFDTDLHDIDAASAWYAEHYIGVRLLHEPRKDEPFRFRTSGRSWRNLAIARITMTSRVEVHDVQTSPDAYIGVDLVSGKWRYELGDWDLRIGAGDAGMVATHGSPKITLDGLDHRATNGY